MFLRGSQEIVLHHPDDNNNKEEDEEDDDNDNMEEDDKKDGNKNHIPFIRASSKDLDHVLLKTYIKMLCPIFGKNRSFIELL